LFFDTADLQTLNIATQNDRHLAQNEKGGDSSLRSE